MYYTKNHNYYLMSSFDYYDYYFCSSSGLETDFKGFTAFCQMVFDHWAVVTGDPLVTSCFIRYSLLVLLR